MQHPTANDLALARLFGDMNPEREPALCTCCGCDVPAGHDYCDACGNEAPDAAVCSCHDDDARAA